MGIKRQQVKHACINCQRACKKCDDKRPCQRCVRQGTAISCIDLVKKRGLKTFSNFQEVPAPELNPDLSFKRSFQLLDEMLIHRPIPETKFSIASLDALATICSEEFLREKSADSGESPDFTVHMESLNRIHTHRLLSDYTPIPRIIPTPPPTPLQSISEPFVNYNINQFK